MVYERGFRYWWLWRAWRGRSPFLRGGLEEFDDEGELIKFVAYFGVANRYAFSTVDGWLHGIQHAHVVQGMGDPLVNKLRLKLVRKGLKRLDKKLRGPTNKLAATAELLLEVVDRGGLEVNSWGDAVLATAVVFGFFKLRRSGEFLRKGEHPDADKCVRVGDCTLAKEGVSLEWGSEDQEYADEIIAVQRQSKADQERRGAVTNMLVSSDPRLCVVAWIKHLAKVRPGHFKDPTRYLFTLSDGRVLNRDKVALALKAGAMRLGLRSEEINVISLRAGGASCMYHAGFRT
jgi:hypothetical protein